MGCQLSTGLVKVDLDLLKMMFDIGNLTGGQAGLFEGVQIAIVWVNDNVCMIWADI